MTLRIYGFKTRLFDSVATFGAGNRTRADHFCALLLALSPILQHYKGIYRNAGFTVLLLISPFLLMRFVTLLKNGSYDRKCIGAIFPLLLFQTYKMFDHTVSFNKTIYGMFMLLLLLMIAAGCVNTRLFIKYATMVSVFAGVALVIQYICYYILGFHLQMVPTSLLLRESSGWILGAKTGLYGIRGLRSSFYRPSAFFLEPSHLFLYSFPVLCLMLFSDKLTPWQRQFAVWTTIGLALSTSGMGVVTAVGLWAVYFSLYYSRNPEKNVARIKNLLSGKNLLILFVILIVLVGMYFAVPVFRSTVNRFLVRGSSGQSVAVAGRTRLARILVSGMSGRQLIVGVTENLNEVDFNMSGFYATLYKYGIIGIALSYWYYGQFVFRLRGAGLWISLVVLVVSFFSAHTHGTFYMMYYVIVQMNAYHMKTARSGEESELYDRYESGGIYPAGLRSQ